MDDGTGLGSGRWGWAVSSPSRRTSERVSAGPHRLVRHQRGPPPEWPAFPLVCHPTDTNTYALTAVGKVGGRRGAAAGEGCLPHWPLRGLAIVGIPNPAHERAVFHAFEVPPLARACVRACGLLKKILIVGGWLPIMAGLGGTCPAQSARSAPGATY